jgi:hypothetical protein
MNLDFNFILFDELKSCIFVVDFNKMFRRFSLLFHLVIPFFLNGQTSASGSADAIYKNQFGGGIMLATTGVGAEGFYGFQKQKKTTWLINLAIGNLKSEKQSKIYNNNYKDARGYYFGKINSLFYLNASFGAAHLLYESKRFQGVEISGVWSAGLNLAYLKPIYLMIREPYIGGQGYEEPVNVRYDPEIHYQENIYGKSPFFTGSKEGKFSSGLQLKAGILFNLSKFDQSIRAIEIGAKIDYFFKPVDLMYASPSKSLFNALYAKFLIGTKRT